MLYYCRIDVSEGIDFNMRSTSKECYICHYWYFLEKGFKSQPYVRNGCHVLSMMSINLNDIAILNIHSVDYGCNIFGIRKSDAVNLLENTDLTEKQGYYKNMKNYYHI